MSSGKMSAMAVAEPVEVGARFIMPDLGRQGGRGEGGFSMPDLGRGEAGRQGGGRGEGEGSTFRTWAGGRQGGDGEGGVSMPVLGRGEAGREGGQTRIDSHANPKPHAPIAVVSACARPITSTWCMRRREESVTPLPPSSPSWRMHPEP